MDVDDDFGTKSAAFLSWLQVSGATVSDKIELVDLRQRNAGRGVGIASLERVLNVSLFKLTLYFSRKNRY
jgi:hypothetical protein